MNDRYLFRAKRTDNGEWILGSLIQTSYLGSIRSWISSEQEDKARLREISSNQAVWRAFEVRTDTICQCTGLKDKNGKLIWENDIVKEFNSSGDEWNLSQIVFGEYSLNLGWCTKGIKTLHEYNRRLFNVGFGTSEAGECEVIGNIFDNLELLEVGE